MAAANVGIRISLDGADQTVAGFNAVSSAMARAEQSASRVGVSAAQTAAAMRSLPAQFTDVFVSLASGQAPLTVLLQQGGQIKDQFGGIVPALKGVGAALSNLINPYTIAAAAIGAIGVAAYKGSQEVTALERALTSSNNAIGLSASTLSDMARSMQQFGTTQSAATASLAEFASSSRIGADQIQRFADTAMLIEEAFGTPIAKTKAAFEELAKAPSDAVIKLNEGVNFLSDALYKQILALEQQGRMVEAGRVAQEAYADSQRKMAQAAVDNAGTLEKAWKAVSDAAKGAWDSMLGIGRQKTIGSQISEIQGELQGLYSRNRGGTGTEASASNQREADILRARLAGLQSIAAYEQQIAAAQGESVRAGQAAVEFRRQGLEYASKQQKMEAAINQARELARAGGVSDADLEKRIADIREKFTEKTKEAKKATDEFSGAQKTLNDLLAKDAGYSSDFLAKWGDLNKLFAAGRVNLDDLQRAQAALLAQQPAIIANNKAEADELSRLAALELKRIAAYEKAEDAAQQQVTSAADMLASIQRETDALSMSNGEREVSNALLALERSGVDQSSAAWDEYAGKIRAAVLQREGVKANIEAANESRRAWEATYKQVETGLTDALLNAAEKGKGFFISLRDSLVQLFKNLVLKPIVSAVIQPITGSITGMVTSAVGGKAASSMLGVGAGAAGAAGAGGSLAGAGAVGMDFGAAAEAGTLATETSFLASLAPALGPALAALAVAYIGMQQNKGGPKTGGIAGDIAALEAAGVVWPSPDNVAALAAQTAKEVVIEGPEGTSLTVANADMTYVNGLIAANEQAAGIISTISPRIATLAEEFGGKAAESLSIGLQYSMDPSGTAATDITGTIGDYVTRMLDVGRSPAEFTAAIGLTTARLVVAGLQSSDLPAQIADIFGAVNISTATETDIANAIAAARAMRTLLDTAELLGIPLDNVTQSMIDAAGGVEALQTGFQSYYQNFYSDAERQANALESLSEQFAALGVEMPATRAGFRALIESLQDSTNAADQATVGALIPLAGAFASLVPEATDAVSAIDSTAAAMSRMTASATAALEATSAWPSADDWISYASDIADPQIVATSLRASFSDAWDALDLSIAEPQSLADYRAAIESLNQAALDGTGSGEDLAAALRLSGEFTRTIAAERAWSDASAGATNVGDSLIELGTTADDTATTIDAATRRLSGADYLAGIESLLSPGEFANRLRPIVADAWTSTVSDALIMSGVADIPMPTTAGEFVQALDYLQAAFPELAATLISDVLPIWSRLYGEIDASTTDVAESVSDAVSVIDDAAARADKIAQERAGLERQLLQAQGDTAALRALDLAALDESNRALQLQIWAIEDAAKAEQEAARAADELARTWRGVSDRLQSEIDRIRGSFGSGADTLAELQARFAIATAAARSGDQAAAESLADLARQIIDASDASASSLLDAERIRAQIAASLEATQSLVSARYIDQTGTRTWAADRNPTQQLASEVATLREDQRIQAGAQAAINARMARIFERWDVDGMPSVRAEV